MAKHYKMRSLLNFNGNKYLKRARHCLALLLTVMFLIAGYTYSFGQYTYFNERIDHYNNYDYSRNIMVMDSGYMIAGFTYDTIYNWYLHLSFTKVDTGGEVEFFKEFGFEGTDMFLGNPGSLITYPDNKYITVGTKRFYTNDWVHDQGMLACYNYNFDTLWIRNFGEKEMPYDTEYMFQQVKWTLDSSLIYTGIRMPKGLVSRIWLLKTDSLGNKLWERFYGEGEEYFQGHSVVQTADGGYVMGAAKFEIHATGGYEDPLIIKTDSLGNEEWRINPGNPEVDDNKVMVALAQDGNIIAGTNYGTDQSGDNRWAVVKIMKIKPDGTVLWDNNYLEPQYDNFLLNTVVLSNGNMIVNGSFAMFDDGPAIISYILCLDSLGTQLWYKEYALLTAHNSFNDLYDVRETSDGGLIGCGRVVPVTPDTGTTDIWLMKMDSTGCLYAGCDTTVVVEETAVSQKYFKLYPNPAKEYITIEYKLDYNVKNAVVEILTLKGNHIETFRLPGVQGVKIIDLRNRKSGIYFIRLSANGKTLQNEKFIKL
ncbi:MAG: hypothetical protein DRI87_07710 [Bacteroidetes bacterium]|nr:MAG: hypothetical protein DRI87_07710 [Bacteroidota bacterium]